MLKGILGDPKTTIVGSAVILLTIGFIVGKIDQRTWMAAVGFIAGVRWVLENKGQ